MLELKVSVGLTLLLEAKKIGARQGTDSVKADVSSVFDFAAFHALLVDFLKLIQVPHTVGGTSTETFKSVSWCSAPLVSQHPRHDSLSMTHRFSRGGFYANP